MNLPRTDVAAGGLAGAFGVLLMIALQNDGVFDFQATVAAFSVLLTFAGGYIARRYKPFFTAVSAALAALLTSAVGFLFFDVPFDRGLVSTGLASILAAAVTYLAPPYDASTLDDGGLHPPR